MDPEPLPGAATADRRLLQLQALDVAVDRLNARRSVLESGEELQAARAVLAEAEGRVGDLRLVLDDVTREQRRLEGDVDAMSRKRDAERRRLYGGSVANARELQSIEAEVANLSNRIEGKEDQLLELMERREELEAQVTAADGEVAEARRGYDEVERTSAGELAEIRRDLGARSAERDDLASQLDPTLLGLYEDLRRQKRGVGAAALVDGVCQGCHQKLSAVYLEQLKRKPGIRRCEYCRRILVLA